MEEDVGLAVMERFRNSPAPEHEHLRAVVGAMAEVLKDQGLPSSPTAYFAATMSSLERQCDSNVHGFTTDPVVTALCTFLALVLPKLSSSVLRSKGNAALCLLVKLLKEHGVLAGTVKSGLTCMEHLMCGIDKSNWLSLAPSFELLLKYCLDPRPKVRRRAQVCIAAVLSSLKGFPALEMASESIFVLLDRSYLNIGGSLRASKGTKGVDGKAMSDAVEVLYVLGAFEQFLSGMSSKAIVKTVAYFGKLLDIRHNLVTKHVLNALQALFTSLDTQLPGAVFTDILEKVAGLISPGNKDTDEVFAAIRLLSKGLEVLHNVDSAGCAKKIPAIFHTVGGLLASGQDGIVFGAAECMKSLITNCIDDSMISQGLCQLELKGTTYNTSPAAVSSICATLESTLGYQYCPAWEMAFTVIRTLFDRLGSSSFTFMGNIVKTLADMQNLSDEYMVCRNQLHDTLGAAVVAMGPENFLVLLPLGMDGEDIAKARVWLLPILKQSVVGARLQYFVDEFLPLSIQLRERAEKYASEGKSVASRNAEACIQSVWSLLPSFCNYPCDTAKSFRSIAKPLGDTLEKEPELRGLICCSLQILIQQNRLARGDQIKLEILEDARLDTSTSIGVAVEKAKKLYTSVAASKNISAIAAFSRNFLPLLFNLFNSAPREKRGDLQSTIGAFATISEKKTIKTFFVTIMQKLLKATKASTENSESLSSSMELEGPGALEEQILQRCTFMDLALSLIQGLDDEAIGMLYSAAKPALLDTNGAIQKKAYKVLASICKEHENFLQRNSNEILEALLTVLTSCQTSAKRYRLLTLRYVMIHLLKVNNQRRDEAIATLLSEVILSLKESNKKTRNASYDLLIGIGRELLQPDNSDSEENLLRFFHMIVGCLAGTTPQMISAAVTGLARLIYEFSSELCHTIPELLPSIFVLLRSRSREIIKSVLGLVKVVIARQPAEDLEKHLPNIIDGLMLWSDDSKNHFKSKVRAIMEKLVHRFGYKLIFSVMPKEHTKLLVNIRKKKEQAKKKQSRNGSAVDETKSSRSVTSTVRSKWDHTDIFSDVSDEEYSDLEQGSKGTRTFSKTSSAAKSRSIKSRKMQISRRLPEENLDVGPTDEPLDLLNTKRMRGALSMKKSQTEPTTADTDVAFAPDGRLIVDETIESRTLKGKRERTEEDNDRDSRQTRSVRRKLGSEDKHKGKHQLKLKSGVSKHRKSASGWAFKGEEYANKRGLGGDIKKEGKMEPYAYWPLDPKMLNRREEKRSAARKGMSSVLKMTRKMRGLSVKKALSPKGYSMKRKQKSHKA